MSVELYINILQDYKQEHKTPPLFEDIVKMSGLDPGVIDTHRNRTDFGIAKKKIYGGPSRYERRKKHESIIQNG